MNSHFNNEPLSIEPCIPGTVEVPTNIKISLSQDIDIDI
jgi:hypothetical protein